MKKIFLKVKRWISLSISSFFYGTKNVESNILTQSGSGQLGNQIMIQDKKHSNSLAKALLNGEETEDVKALRYKLYLTDREANNWKYVTPTFALKKKAPLEITKRVLDTIDTSDGRNVILVQDNEEYSENYNIVYDGNLSKWDGKSKYIMPKEIMSYTLKVDRSDYTRFKIEEFVSKFVLKECDEKHRIIDFYVTMYDDNDMVSSDTKNFRRKSFIKEIDRIKNGVSTDTFNMDELRFVTCKACGKYDMFKYSFTTPVLEGIYEFDGSYIIRVKFLIKEDGIDLTKAFYCKEQDMKYKNKERKNCDYLMNPSSNKVTYKCEECGKEVVYDPSIAITDDDNGIGTTDYWDMQIVEKTIGKKLCKDCLKKYLETKS